MNLLRYRTDKRIENSTIKDVRNLFRIKKENKAIHDRIIREILGTFWSKKKIITNQ